MGHLSVFNFITLNGYYKGLNDDISWHRHGQEESDFASDAARPEGILMFGRVTYEMMMRYWPTEQAKQSVPAVANSMNNSKKIVFSRTLKKATWNNSQLVNDNIETFVRTLKQGDKNITILGSGSIVTQLADKGLIDSYQFMLDPVALGDGTPAFKGMTRLLDLTLTSVKNFKSGVVLLNYVPLVGKRDTSGRPAGHS